MQLTTFDQGFSRMEFKPVARKGTPIRPCADRDFDKHIEKTLEELSPRAEFEVIRMNQDETVQEVLRFQDAGIYFEKDSQNVFIDLGGTEDQFNISQKNDGQVVAANTKNGYHRLEYKRPSDMQFESPSVTLVFTPPDGGDIRELQFNYYASCNEFRNIRNNVIEQEKAIDLTLASI